MTLNCLCFWTKWPVSYGKGSYFHAKKHCVSFQIPCLIDNLALPFFDQILIFYIWSTAHPQNFFFIGSAFSFLFEIHFMKRTSTGSILVEKWISHNWQDLTNYSNAFKKRTFSGFSCSIEFLLNGACFYPGRWFGLMLYGNHSLTTFRRYS